MAVCGSRQQNTSKSVRDGTSDLNDEHDRNTLVRIRGSKALKSLARPKTNAVVDAMDIDDEPVISPRGKNRRGAATSPLLLAEPMEVSPCTKAAALPVNTTTSSRDDLHAIEVLRSRLMYPNSSSMPLRPSLQSAHDELVSMMDRVVVEEGSTSSVLLLGERGTGKTLVSRSLFHHILRSSPLRSTSKT